MMNRFVLFALLFFSLANAHYGYQEPVVIIEDPKIIDTIVLDPTIPFDNLTLIVYNESNDTQETQGNEPIIEPIAEDEEEPEPANNSDVIPEVIIIDPQFNETEPEENVSDVAEPIEENETEEVIENVTIAQGEKPPVAEVMDDTQLGDILLPLLIIGAAILAYLVFGGKSVNPMPPPGGKSANPMPPPKGKVSVNPMPPPKGKKGLN
jgi:hypothetical protein